MTEEAKELAELLLRMPPGAVLMRKSNHWVVVTAFASAEGGGVLQALREADRKGMLFGEPM